MTLALLYINDSECVLPESFSVLHEFLYCKYLAIFTSSSLIHWACNLFPPVVDIFAFLYMLSAFIKLFIGEICRSPPAVFFTAVSRVILSHSQFHEYKKSFSVDHLISINMSASKSNHK